MPVCASRYAYDNGDRDDTRIGYATALPSGSDSSQSHPVMKVILLSSSATFIFSLFSPYIYVRPANRSLPTPVFGTPVYTCSADLYHTNPPRRFLISNIVGDQSAKARQELAIEAAFEPITLTPVSIGDSSYATTQESVHASGRQEYEEDVDATIKITTRTRDTILPRIPDLSEVQVCQVE